MPEIEHVRHRASTAIDTKTLDCIFSKGDVCKERLVIYKGTDMDTGYRIDDEM